MRTGTIIDGAAGLVLVWMLVTLAAHGQTTHVAAAHLPLSAPGRVHEFEAPPGELVREIDDPNNGDRWLLMRDETHPGGPGVLVLAGEARTGRGDRGDKNQSRPQAGMPAPVIRAGDRVIIEENTPVVEARLEAVAMNPALAGSVFNARLSIGGRVVRALATTPGRAVFEEETGR